MDTLGHLENGTAFFILFYFVVGGLDRLRAVTSAG